MAGRRLAANLGELTMAEPSTPDALEPLPKGRFAGREAFETSIRLSLAHAAREGWSNICLMDADFADWPLGERGVEAALQDWSQTGRRMVLMAKQFDTLRARHHRFVAWRRQWGHIVECWQCTSADPLDFPSGMITPRWALHRVDREHGVCIAFTESSRILGLQELRNEWLRKCSPGFPATLLGL
jgi:hypothetical protein